MEGLISKKKEIESEILALGEILSSHGVGMNDNLVDKDGYPRPDLDIITIRKSRVRIICLQNDLKKIMTDIENGLHDIHAKLRENISTDHQTNVSRTTVRVDSDLDAFLHVDQVVRGSPAEMAGLQVDDLVIRFGSITFNNFVGLEMIGSLVNDSKGKEIEISIKRETATKNITLVPNVWKGKGLLGCNVVPIKR